MSEFLLVHGSCHGAWCWRDLIPALEARGHGARAIDLPTHGADGTPIAEATLMRYAEAILGAIDTMGGGPVTVIGHSMGGFPITQAACLAPERIARLIYVCAYVPAPGMTLVEMRRAGPYQPLEGALDISGDGSWFTFKPERTLDLLYQDCPAGTVDYARQHLCREPTLPANTPILGSHRVPRSYVRCTRDATIPPEYQVAMSAGWDSTRDLDCGHSPFFACPEALADAVTELA
ncbi:alpha/beta fold hydrolase [Aliiroseovarius sp.]|uniref:alpha/beta fold hydrolase n=1 Tax=Aliiroseovarius sp. TaxID=1872442 RepID=UPI00261D436E|nr:alpha/beta fold hydrolase [Aliiroseovarius sp.]